jgi:hypothetical protein
MRDAVGPFSAFEASQTHIQAGGDRGGGRKQPRGVRSRDSPFESQAQAAKRGIENTIPRRLSSLTFTSTLGSQSKRATI